MDFNLTEEQQILLRTVWSFAEKELAPTAFESDDKGDFPRDVIRKVANQGLLGIVIPQKYGGCPLGHLSRLISIEEISRVHPSMGLFLQATPLGLWTILRFGDEEQRHRYISPVVKGEEIMCMAVTEPIGGSDPAAIRTSAKLEGDEYIVNGGKCFVTNGSVADICVFVARTGKGSKGLSVFLVEKGTPGFSSGARERHTGFRSMEIAELFFKNCRIPKRNLIGKEGEGLKAALTAISEIGRIGNAAVALGLAKAARETAIKYATTRRLYGRPILELQAIQFALADVDTRIEAARWLAYYAAWLLDQGKGGKEITKEIARAKLFTSEIARDAALLAVQIHGAYGTLPEFKAIRYLLDSLETIAAAGTNETMRRIIGQSLQ